MMSSSQRVPLQALGALDCWGYKTNWTREAMHDHPMSELKLISSTTATEWRLDRATGVIQDLLMALIHFYRRLFWSSNSEKDPGPDKQTAACLNDEANRLPCVSSHTQGL